MVKKFQIYYSPKNNLDVYSFTLSFSRINEDDDTYKLKIIKEIKKNSFQIETYKIKEFHFNAKEIINKINQIDFEEKYDSYCNGDDMYYIQYEDKKITTSNKQQIEYILDLFNFDELYNINISQYDKIKDVYEFIKLNRLFLHKISKIESNDLFLDLYEFYLNKNPYKIFENLNNLDNFCFS